MDYVNKPVATRKLGDAYIELMEKDPNLWVLNADLAGSLDVAKVRERFPDRAVECGIAEQNMASIAYGLATTGKKVIVNTFAQFMGRAHDQIYQAGRGGEVTIIYRATHAGIGVGQDGESAQAVGDIGMMSSNAGIDYVVDPVDINEAVGLLRVLLQLGRQSYMRTYRQDMPIILPKGFEAGIGKGYLVPENTDADIAIVASGPMAEQALAARKILEKDSIGVKVIAFSTIKPIPTAEQAEPLIGSSRLVITAEDHLRHWGLGAAFSHALNRLGKRHEKIGLDGYGATGTHAGLYEKFRLDAKGIAEQAKEFARLYNT